MTDSEESTSDVPLLQRLKAVRPWLPARWPLIAIAGLAAVAGLIEALVVTVIAAAAGALAEGAERIEVGLGPFDIDTSVTDALWVGLAATAVMVGLRILSGWVLADFGRMLLSGTRARLLDQYLSAPYSVQTDSVQAELHELIVDRALRLTQLVMLLAAALGSAFGFLSMIAMAIVLSPVVALSLVVASGVLAGVFLPLFRRTHDAGRVHMQSQIDVGVIVGDAAGLLAETHVYDAKEGLLDRASTPVLQSGYSFRTAAFSSQVGTIGYVGAVFVLLLVGLMVVVHLEVGDPATLGAITLIMLRGLRQSQSAQTAVHQASEIFPHVTAVVELAKRFTAATRVGGSEDLERIDVLEFHDVSYVYANTSDGVYDVSLQLHRGELVGVVGPSGAGKSTFAELVMGLRDPSSGSISVNGIPRDSFDRSQWFRRVAYVAQNPRLLEGSLAENVAFFRSASVAEIDDAITAAALDSDVTGWDKGRDHPVGIGGQNLSGGQRQRIAIARALLGEPDLVVFDEPTSALDVESERVVRDTIASLGSDSIVLLVSHRPSTLELCSRLVSFQNGRMSIESVPEAPAEESALPGSPSDPPPMVEPADDDRGGAVDALHGPAF